MEKKQFEPWDTAQPRINQAIKEVLDEIKKEWLEGPLRQSPIEVIDQALTKRGIE